MIMPAVDLSDSEVWNSGFPDEVFTLLRRESPVFHHEFTEQVQRDFWICSKHRECVRIHRDAESFTATGGPLIQPIETFSEYPVLINMDEPDVSQRRKIISRAFTPRAVAKLEAGIRRRAKRMVDDLCAAGGGDWVTQVAGPLPMNVIGDIVGIPEADRPRVFELVDKIVMCMTPESGIGLEEQAGIYMDVFQYASTLTAEKRRRPADDIWSALCTATADDGGSGYALEENELENFFFVLSFAGSDTTKIALTRGLQAFVEHPEQLSRYRSDESIRSSAVEEVLRWTTPVAFWVRGAKVDLELDGQRIPAGSRVVSMLASANRDEEVFPDPFAFDISRTDNPHVTFGGGGPHYCLGANLARAEIRAVLDELLTRPVTVTLGEPTVMYPNLGSNMYIYQHLPIQLA